MYIYIFQETILPSKHVTNSVNETHIKGVYHKNKIKRYLKDFPDHLEYFQKQIIQLSGFASLQHLLSLVYNGCIFSLVVSYCLHHLQTFCSCFLPSTSLVDPLCLLLAICNNILHYVDFNLQIYPFLLPFTGNYRHVATRYFLFQRRNQYIHFYYTCREKQITITQNITKMLCKLQMYYLSSLSSIFQVEKNTHKTLCYYLNHFHCNNQNIA